MGISTAHEDYNLERWEKNRIVIKGQDAVKESGVLFLPDDSYGDNTDDARERYRSLLVRALFVPIAQRTRAGLNGSIFRKPAEVELQPNIEYVLEDCDGAGSSLEQFASDVCIDLMTVGRYGILVDYPSAEPGMSKEQVQMLNLRASFVKYPAESILDWRVTKMSGQLKTTFVKLKECVEEEVSLFETRDVIQYRVLRLDESGNYIQEVYNQSGDVIEMLMPRDSNGTFFDTIPFVIIGAEENSFKVDEALLSGIVDINIAHYQVMADKLRNLHIHSGGLLAISSKLSSEDFAEQNPNGIRVGADQGLFLGEGGSASVLQLEASSQSQTEIESLERQAVAVGARLITDSTANETAEAARIRASASASNLSRLVGNASEAIEAALEYCVRFMGGDPDKVIYKLNMEFFEHALSAQDIMAMIQLVDRGDIGKSDMRTRLRKAGWVERSDVEIDEETGGAL